MGMIPVHGSELLPEFGNFPRQDHFRICTMSKGENTYYKINSICSLPDFFSFLPEAVPWLAGAGEAVSPQISMN